MTIIRAGEVADADRYLALKRAIYRWEVGTPVGARHRLATILARPGAALFAAEYETAEYETAEDGTAEDGTADAGPGLAGFAMATPQIWTSEPGASALVVLVAPDVRGRGVGSALLAAAEAHLRECGLNRVEAWALGEPAHLDWAWRRGYQEAADMRYSRLSLADIPARPSLPDGVTAISVEELGPERTYAVDSVAMMDEPSQVPIDRVEYKSWLDACWHNPNERHDLSVAVLVDGQPATCTYVEGDPVGGRMMSAGTATLPAYRGRGLAKLAKVIALHRARDAGFVEAFAGNDERNGPMLAVNTWLGYRPFGREVSFLKTL